MHNIYYNFYITYIDKIAGSFGSIQQNEVNFDVNYGNNKISILEITHTLAQTRTHSQFYIDFQNWDL